MAAEQQVFEFESGKPSGGYPELHWTGKRPYTSTRYFPAQCKERYGKEQDGWINRLYWGDNIHVMSHLLKEFRGKIDLIYIDPPFDSNADYKKKIKIRGENALNDSTVLKEKQYRDIWTNDGYLQFMYERLILMRELLSDTGSIYLHCDWHKSHHLRMLMDEVFGPNNFRNEIAWCYLVNKGNFLNKYPPRHDTILFFAKTNKNFFAGEEVRMEPSEATLKRWGAYAHENGEVPYEKLTPGMKRVAGKDKKPYVLRGGIQVDWITKIPGLNSGDSNENINYPTQKPEKLLEIFIKASSNPGGIVFDCFMGSGTTQAVAMKLGRKFIGADINPGAIHTAAKRLLKIKQELESNRETKEKKYTSFEVYNVNNYDFFRNPLKAEADVQRKDNKLIIKKFYPINLMQKLGLDRKTVSDWKELADSVMIDFDYAGAEMQPALIDIPEKNKFVKGEYDIPKDAGRIKLKITDLLSESLELILE